MFCLSYCHGYVPIAYSIIPSSWPRKQLAGNPDPVRQGGFGMLDQADPPGGSAANRCLLRREPGDCRL